MNNQEQLIERLTRFYHEAGGEVSSVPPSWVGGNQRSVRWLQPAMASLAVVVLAVGLAVTVRVAREEAQRNPPATIGPSLLPLPIPAPFSMPSPTTSPLAAPSWVTRRVALGQVQAMSLDASAIFVLYSPNPVRGGVGANQMRLARIDRATGAGISTGPFPNGSGMARTASGLWLAAGADQSRPAADTQWLTLIDPVTLKVKQRVRLPGSPEKGASSEPQLSGTGNVMWLGYGHSLYRLDPATGRTTLRQSLLGTAGPISIDPSGRRLYVAVNPPAGTNYDALIIEWDAFTGTRIGSVVTGGAGLGGPQVVATPTGYWVAFPTSEVGVVEYIGAADLTDIIEPQRQGTKSIRVYLGGGALWFVDPGTGQVACADPRNGTVAASSQESSPAIVVADANGSYLGDAHGVGFLRPDPACPQ
jgi:hypothetical protein